MAEKETTFSKTLYGINALVCSIILVICMILMVAEKLPNTFLGLVFLSPIMVMHSYAYINPERFYYAWNGWWNLLKLGLGVATIPALWILLPEPEKEYNAYAYGGVVVAVLYVIPELFIPVLNYVARMAWEVSSGVLNISKKPGYVMGDIVIPSLIVGSNMMGLGLIANQFLY